MTGPLIDFFRRGDVARDARLLAARGALAPRAHDQLAILALLVGDVDPEIRQAAETTLARIPPAVLAAFLARSDVPDGLRAFFADRGIVPADVAAESANAPLVDTDPDGSDDASSAAEDKPPTLRQRVAGMGLCDRLKAAMKGSREMRAILVRDPHKMIALAVLSSPRLTESEVESIARMADVSEEVLRTIGANRAWTRKYAVVAGLTRNPKTPLAMSLNLMTRLNDRDLAMLSIDRNVPEPLRIAARKRVVSATGGRA